TSGQNVTNQVMEIGQVAAPFGTDLLFSINGTKVGAEICEDVFAPINPATYAALAGAEVIVNLSASDEVIGKADYRRLLVAATSGKLITGYVYASAGRGESVADVVYGGHQLIGESGRLVAERKPLSDDTSPLIYDIDRTYIEHDRLTNKTWAKQALQYQTDSPYRTIGLSVPMPNDAIVHRRVEQSTHKPSNPERLDARCEEIFSIMSHALAQRIMDAGSQSIVLGLSGGLDSTLALLTALEATKLLGKPASFIQTVTMPGPASSERTQDNAVKLAEALGTSHRVIPIGNMSMNLLAAIGHDQKTEDITYENAQARMRTALLMEYANHTGGFVQGTGDLSEKAIGWCTFNGDHMSMYNPNAGVPKSLVRNLVSWVAERKVDGDARDILHDIVATPISPELTGNGDLSQGTEDINGPYELIDFFHKELHRYGSRLAKIGYLALRAYGDTYDEATIGQWLDGFAAKYTRSQWKRDVAPNGPKIGTVADSPRSDLRMAPNTSPNWYK
ncbi:MAG TPA: NAD(+) synthase, partial [Verrucomicrobiae bacterium]|nr:NAD(+) synthase [Verrucomicrobiae bacterium]